MTVGWLLIIWYVNMNFMLTDYLKVCSARNNVQLLSNQALVAMGKVNKEVFKGNPDFFPIRARDYSRFLVISLGIGSSKDEKYSANTAKNWGALG